MPATKISELLPIPEGTKTPHAYQVFGLEGGEQDSEKIKLAVAEIYRRLREAKPDTDPELWRKAAKIVEKARSILSDPKKRAALDARFGVIDFDNEDAGGASQDPLAGILPASDPLASGAAYSDPLAAVVPSGNPMAVGATMQPSAGMAPMGVAPTAPNPMTPPSMTTQPQPGSTAVEDFPQPGTTQTAGKSNGHPIVRKKTKSTKRRRKTDSGMLLFGAFMLAMFGVIGGLIYFLNRDGRIAINTGEKPPRQLDNPKPRPQRPRPRRVTNNDPVLPSVPNGPARPVGSLAHAAPNANAIGAAVGEVPSIPIENEPMESTEPMEATEPMETDVPTQPPETPPDGETTTTSDDATPNTPEEMSEETGSEVLPVTPGEQQSDPAEMTDEMIAMADAAIANVEKLIQEADWEQMKPAASKVTEMTLTDEQREYADTLYHLADLATFYRGGIVRGIGSLQTASTFEVAEGVSVLVVETTPNGLTIRRGSRNKDYTLDDMPFTLSETLCSFALSPDKPDNIAARSCYQAVAPQSNPDYRKDATTWLEFVNDDVEGVDTQKVAEAIKKLFPD